MRTLNEPIASWTKKIGTLRSNTIPSPFEHLGSYNWTLDSERLVGLGMIAHLYLYLPGGKAL